MKIAKHSIEKKNAYFLEVLYHLNKNQRTAFLQTVDEIHSFYLWMRF